MEAVVLSVKQEEKRIALGLKQALGDPWADAPKKFLVGSAIEGLVTRLMNFGAFVQLSEGVEGLVHISEITAERRINHPQDVLRVGQTVKAQVLAIDPGKRQFKLSIKQLVPTSIKEYLAEHKVNDVVSGRVVEQSAYSVIVELGEGILAQCRIAANASPSAGTKQGSAAGVDLSALSSMLNARWKGNLPAVGSQPEPLSVGQIRSFRIAQSRSRVGEDRTAIGLTGESARAIKIERAPLRACNHLTAQDRL